MATPRRTHTSICLLVASSVFACGKEEPKVSPQPTAQPSPASVDAAAVTAPTDAESSSGKITISVSKPKAPGSGFAKRCAIGGSPLASTCTGGSKGVAIDKAGVVYVVNEKHLHRYKPVAGEPCKLEPDGEPIELPPDDPTSAPRPQTVGKGPLYMRSGGVAWELVQTPDEIYVHDFLVGLFRVDRGKVEPACTEVFGFRTITKLGKRLVGKRGGIEELVLGKAGKCKAKSAGIDDKARDDIYAVGDKLYSGFSKLVRYDAAPTELAAKARFCAITAMTACGDGACILDHNCPKIVQLAPDGSLLREIDSDKLFDTRPWSLDAAATAADGSVYLYARHRDKVGDKETCEAAVYAVPAAVFAR